MKIIDWMLARFAVILRYDEPTVAQVAQDLTQRTMDARAHAAMAGDQVRSCRACASSLVRPCHQNRPGSECLHCDQCGHVDVWTSHNR